MLKQPERVCDHCQKPLAGGAAYLLIDCSVQFDIPGRPGVTPDSVRTLETKQVELHPDCASAFFQTIAQWLPEARALQPPVEYLALPSADQSSRDEDTIVAKATAGGIFGPR